MERGSERRLMRMMARHRIGELQWCGEGDEMSLSLDGLTPLHPEIRAPQAGRFLTCHPSNPEEAIFPRPVHVGEIVAYLSAGALLVPVIAGADAILPPPLAGDGDIVGYDEILF